MVKSISSMHANTSVATVNEIPPSYNPTKPVSGSKPIPTRKKPTARQTLSKASTKLTTPFKKAPPTFTLFSSLPAEIRLQIWEETIEGRVHELHPCAHLYQNRMTFRSNASTTPSIFHASKESREVAMKHFKLMEYTPGSHINPDGSGPGKGILRFYFAPKFDTLLLNSLMGLFVMFMLLEEESTDPEVRHILNTGGPTAGVMKGWERVAIDAERAQLITLLSGVGGHSPQPRFKKLLPDLKELVIAFDYSKKGKTRFRTSVWPGENGTSLGKVVVPAVKEEEWAQIVAGCVEPLEGFLKNDYTVVKEETEREKEAKIEAAEHGEIVETTEGDEIPKVGIAKVQRKRYVRGDLRYAFRWSCSILGLRPRGIFRRL